MNVIGWIKDHEIAILIVLIVLAFIALLLTSSYVMGGDVCNCTQCNMSANWKDTCISIANNLG